MNQESSNLLVVKDLEVTVPRNRATAQKILRGIGFSIGQAERVGLLGESGSGKSTCARALLRLLGEDLEVRGQVCFEGQDLFTLPAAKLRQIRPRIQMIFQDPFSSFDPRQKVADALTEVLRVHFRPNLATVRTRVSTALVEVGLNDDFLLKTPAQLSGGQLQRVSLARALLFEPKILIADEAVSALDLSLQAQIVTLLSELSVKRKMSVLFISHDLRLVRYFCDRVLVLHGGAIVESGEVEEVFVRPQAQYTKELIQAAIHGKAAVPN